MRKAKTYLMLLGVLTALSCCHATGTRGAALLSAPAEKPRLVVIGLRSFTGSQVAFLAAAAQMLKTSPHLKLQHGALIEVYAAQGTSPGYMSFALMFESSLPVNSIVGLMQGVEERLADPLYPGVRQTLRADLLWVEDLEVKTPEIELPNPAVFKESWAIGAFVGAGEDAVHSKIDAARLLHALKTVPPPHEIYELPPGLPDPKLKRLPDRDVWSATAYDWLDGLADAGWVLAYSQTDLESGKREMDRLAMADIPQLLSGPVDRQPADRVVLIEPPAAAGDDTSLATAWVRELQRRLIETSTRLSIPVVFSVEGGKIRGLAVGCADTPPSAVRVVGIKAVADPVETHDRALAAGRPNRPHIELQVDRSTANAGRP